MRHARYQSSWLVQAGEGCDGTAATGTVAHDTSACCGVIPIVGRYRGHSREVIMAIDIGADAIGTVTRRICTIISCRRIVSSQRRPYRIKAGDIGRGAAGIMPGFTRFGGVIMAVSAHGLLLLIGKRIVERITELGCQTLNVDIVLAGAVRIDDTCAARPEVFVADSGIIATVATSTAGTLEALAVRMASGTFPGWVVGVGFSHTTPIVENFGRIDMTDLADAVSRCINAITVSGVTGQ